MLKCKFEFSMFGVFAGIEPATSGQIVSCSDQLSKFYIVLDLSMLFENSQGEGQHHSSLELQRHACDRPAVAPSQRIITAHPM